MASIEEIDEVVNLFRDAKCPFELLHCISTYPMPDKDANLLCIPMLRERYRCDVGYSGHESSGHKVCVAAVALGATTLERHITLDRAMYGSDQAASLETPSLQSFASAVRAIPEALGTGTKAITDAEKAVREKLRVDIVV
jgi:N-acetylneuraminate synthase